MGLTTVDHIAIAVFNIQQALASGMIGGGAAMIVAVIAQLVQKPKPPADDQPTPKRLSPLLAVLLIAIGLGIVVVGVIWRASSQNQGQVR